MKITAKLKANLDRTRSNIFERKKSYIEEAGGPTASSTTATTITAQAITATIAAAATPNNTLAANNTLNVN